MNLQLTPEEFGRGEEIANAISHGVGIGLSIAALVLLTVFATIEGAGFKLFGALFFGIALIILYSASTLLHTFAHRRIKDLFQVLDHSAIYILIAGTYTPFLVTVLRGTVGWILFGVVWGIALVGIVFKSLYVKKYKTVATGMYVIMGWLIVFLWSDIVEALDFLPLLWLILGGVSYTIGSLFYVLRLFPYHHFVWHLFVILGSCFHFFAVLFGTIV